MAKKKPPDQKVWYCLHRIAVRRSQFFLKHGERFDRRLYAEVESIIRISLMLQGKGLIEADTEKFKELTRIQRELLYTGQEVYEEFP